MTCCYCGYEIEDGDCVCCPNCGRPIGEDD